MADGYIVSKRRGKDNKLRSRLELCLQKNDKKHLKKFAKSLNATYPIKDGIAQRNGKKTFRSVIEIYNKELCQDLINYGCVQNKSFCLKYPLIPYNLNRHFIRGYFDGDGCISYNKFYKRI